MRVASPLRLFIACELSQEIIERIRGVQAILRQVRGRVSWVKPEMCHLTLRFLGDRGEEEVEGLHRALLDSVAGLAPFPMTVGGIGAFPSLLNPKVIWLGVKGGEKLADLQRRVEEALSDIGIEKEKRPFHPHVTIGRVRHSGRKGAFNEVFERAQRVEAGAATVERIVLFSSTLSPSGARYSIVREAGLGKEHCARR